MSHPYFTFSNSWLFKVSKFLELGLLAKILVPSAKIQKESFLEELEISFIYKRKSKGPRELPCGVLQTIVCLGDSKPLIEIYVLLSVCQITCKPQ